MDARWFRKYSDIVKEAEQVTQEAEQLDELSPELLGRAKDKAYSRAVDFHDLARKKNPSGDENHPISKLSQAYMSKSNKFRKGEEKAYARDSERNAIRDIGASTAALRKAGIAENGSE